MNIFSPSSPDWLWAEAGAAQEMPTNSALNAIVLDAIVVDTPPRETGRDWIRLAAFMPIRCIIPFFRD
jgi:hypothetical protein